MLAQGAHDRFPVAGLHSLQQPAVLGSRAPRPAPDQVDQVEGILRPQHLYEMQRLRQLRDRIELPVKTIVDGAHGFAVAAHVRFVELALKVRENRIVLWRDVLHRGDRQLRLEQYAKLVDLSRCRRVEWRDDHTAMRLAQYVSFGFEDAKRFAHRRDAELQLLRDVRLLEPRAPREAPGENAFPQMLGYKLFFCFEIHGMQAAG